MQTIAPYLFTRHNGYMKWGIKHQLLLLAFVPTIITSALLSFYFISTHLQDIEETFRLRGKTMAAQLAASSEYNVYLKNLPLLKNLAKQTLQQPNVQSVDFYTPQGEPVAQAGKAFLPLHPQDIKKLPLFKLQIKEKGHIMAFILPLHSLKANPHTPHLKAEHLLGWLKLELDTKSIQLQQQQILRHSSLIFLLGLGVCSLLAHQMSRKISGPILKMAEAVSRIKQGELNTRINLTSYQELEVLEAGINTMTAALQNAHTELQNKIEQSTSNLRRTLETIEVQNIELEIARRTAENANKIKSEFLADMSHEIRTPLSGVIGFINLLGKTELNSKQRGYISTIQKSANNLLAIINDILDFSKIEAGKLKIDRIRMDIRECIDEILNLLAPYAEEKNISLIPLIYSNVPALVLGDPLRLKQIITNLVNNSIKFTEQGSVIIRVMLEQEHSSTITIRVSVSDTGIGLSTAEQETLFQAFNQIKTSTSRKLGGTGLGLVICKKLVEQMGGSIGVESAPQKGATFWFTFQVEKYQEDISSTPLPLETAFLARTPLQNALEPPIKILAVDDSSENLQLITILLENMGIEVTGARSAEEAIKAVKKQSFQLILMDIRMPKINGIEAVQRIRDLEVKEGRIKTPIIAITAHILPHEKNTLLSAGIDDYLTKPIDEIQLRSLIQHWIKSAETLEVVDWELAKRLAGGRLKLAKELFEKLTISLPTEKARINENFLNQDWDSLRNNVHKLHGACCYCGVPQLKECVQKLENAVSTYNPDLIRTHLENFNLAVEAVLEYKKANLL